MSIQTELTRIINAKAAIKTAIEGKGVTVPDGAKLDALAELIESIEAGGGGGNIATGTLVYANKTWGPTTISHNLGSVPEYMIMYKSPGESGTSSSLIFAVSAAEKAMYCNYTTNTSVSLTESDVNLQQTKSAAYGFWNATTEIVKTGSMFYFIAGATYTWIAIGSGVIS